ncbi:nuclear factor 7, ovary-like [Hemitrygon akajei]|uniref:nuclear factor 7, ovary-like n=1 Tax=Hemitrygon akajei TaxID=2704970 RepID=UPI003BFA2BFC
MASKGETESSSEEAICPICLDFFTDPVSLECGHNFCRSCISRGWEREERNSCPERREEFADRTLRVNRALANLAENFRNLNLNPKGKESKRHCEEHEEELKLFCETDKTLICLVCAVAEEHREHGFKPIKEAAKNYKDQLKSPLDSLTKKKSDFQEKEQQQKEKISGVQEQSHSLQSHITSQFAELRQIITEKEQSLLSDLREEEKRILNPMEKNLREIQENIRIIQEEITKLKEQVDQKDSVIFLKEEARRNRRINDDVQELSVTDETLPVEKFDHIYLLKTVLRETLDAINRVSKNERRSHGNTKFFQGSTGRSEGGCFPCPAENPWGDISCPSAFVESKSLSPWMWKRRVRISRCLRIGRV